MKVIICKFFSEDHLEGRVRQTVAREKRRADNSNMSVFCVAEPVRKRLELAGIPSEVLEDFQRHTGAEDESSWEKVYELSDELRASADNDSALKFTGVNFLTLERNIIEYVFAVKLSNLCARMSAQNCEVLILVLTGPCNDWLADINSARIKTVRYGDSIRSHGIARLAYGLMVEGYLLLAHARDYLRRLVTKERPAANKSKSEKQPGVLFVVSTPLYARPAMAIGDECLKNGLVPFVATDDRTLLPLLQRHNVEYAVEPPVSLSLASSVRVSIPAHWLPRRLRRHIASFHGGKADEFSAARLCQETLLRQLPGLCREAVSGILFLEKLINRTSPDIVCVMPQNGFLQQLAWATAKRKYGIPVLAGSAAWETSDARSFRRHMHADRIAVMGERIRDIYIESGMEPDRVVATGVAHFDRLFHRDREQDDLALQRHGIDPARRIIVFATEGLSVGETVEALRGVIAVVPKMKDTQLVVKVHPAEDMKPYQAVAEPHHDPRIHVVRDIDLYTLISRCELMIVKFSTVALEAMMVDKPVLVINLSGKPVPVPYAEEGAALGVYRSEDIEPAILKALHDQETRARIKVGRDRFVRSWAGEPDGRASVRIVNLMKEMIAESHKAGKGQYAG